jgi:hypothetical protein
LISKINFTISSSIIFFLLLNKLCNSKILLALSLSIIIFLFLNSYIKEESIYINKLRHFFIRYFRWVFYSQAIIFGFLHLTNYRIDFKYFYLFPLFAITYISTGCFWGYLRVRYKNGIFLCIASHVLINSLYFFILKH